MTQQIPEFKNILVIHFGQLGDVVLGLPALRAIRTKFPHAKLTVMSGKSTSAIINIAQIVEDQIIVDRVALRDGGKLRSIRSILKLVSEVRRRKFDFVIDLNSLYETNLLGFFGGIPQRLYADRKGRSLNILCNFPEKPPPEDRSKHVAVRYLDVLKPLGVEVEPVLELVPAQEDLVTAEKLFNEHEIDKTNNLVGMFLGAGHPDRRWPLKKFATLAARLSDDGLRVLVFLGPEESDLLAEVKSQFPLSAVILDKLKLPELFAVLTFLKLLVSNDTGPTHLAAATDVSIILISHERAPNEFRPLTKRLTVIDSGTINEISVDVVYSAVMSALENDKTCAA